MACELALDRAGILNCQSGFAETCRKILIIQDQSSFRGVANGTKIEQSKQT